MDKTGRIGRIERTGLGIIVEEGDNKEYPFTCDVVKGYGGQSVSDFGLKKGLAVRFVVGVNNQVISVRSDPDVSGERRVQASGLLGQARAFFSTIVGSN